MSVVYALPPLTDEFAASHGARGYSGNFSPRSIAWKRGSLRRGSRSGSVFTCPTPGSGSCTALISQFNALGETAKAEAMLPKLIAHAEALDYPCGVALVEVALRHRKEALAWLARS